MQMGTLGERLRQKRVERKLSQDQLGKLSGLSKSTIRDLEVGASRTTTRLHHVAEALGVNLLWLEMGVGPENVNASGDEPVKNAGIQPRPTSQIDTALAPMLAQAESWVRFEEWEASKSQEDLWGPADGSQSVRRATRIILYTNLIQARGGFLVREEALAIVRARQQQQGVEKNGAVDRGSGGGATE